MINETYKTMLGGKSVIRTLSEYAAARGTEIGYDNVFDYSLGNPSVPCPSSFTKAMIDMYETADPVALHGYSPSLGNPEACRTIAESLNRRFGMDYTAGHIFPTTGAAGALAHALRAVTKPGDEVLTVTPYFVEYGSYVGNHGGTLKKVPTLPGTFGLDLPAIEAAITPKTRAMIINSPHNPTGTVYSREELEGLTAILAKASERNGRPLYLVVDEPYRFLAFDGVEVPSLLPMYPYAVLASSFSKNLCLAGERVGFIALSPLFAERAELMGGLTLANRILGFVNPPVVGQHIMAGALGSQVDVNIYARRREMMGNVLSDAGYEFQMPKGAFYFFPKAPGGDDVAFVNKLLDERILAVPGSGFGGPGHFRLAFCVEDEVIARSAEGFKRARG